MDINIGERITHLRVSRGYTVNRLANKAGISQSYLREIEMGHYCNPSVDVLDSLCDVLGISLKEFFDKNLELREAEDSLLKEIASLTSSQRENLRIFLQSLHDR